VQLPGTVTFREEFVIKERDLRSKNYNAMMAYPKAGGLPRKVAPVGAPEVAKL
jgi:hypothetical protein